MMNTEGITKEFKREYTDDIKKTVIAFANTNGGEIWIGVTDDSTVVGVTHPDATILQVTNAIRDSIKPDITMHTLCEIRRLSLIHISEPTRLGMISYAVFCLKKKKKKKIKKKKK